MALAALILKQAHTEYSSEETWSVHVSWAGWRVFSTDTPEAASPWGASSMMHLITNTNRSRGGMRGQKHVHAAPVLG